MFLYDALGNRYGKLSSVGDAPITEADITMYIRDAQGNPLEIYDYSFEDLGDNEYRESLKLNERIFYGSSRIATETDINEEVAFAEFSVDSEDYPYEGDLFAKLNVSTTFVDPDPKKFSLMRGRKHFELTNHLGNVLATVSDKRFPIDGKYSWVLGAAGTGDYNFVDGAFVYDEGNGNYEQDEASDGTIDFYMPKVTMANRYYPFGMVQPNSDNISGNTRYGFNGMERDGEVTSGSYTTPFRELDARLGGRWWSRDPIVKPWESPYAGFANNPIYFNDPSGLDPGKGKGNKIPKNRKVPREGKGGGLRKFFGKVGDALQKVGEGLQLLALNLQSDKQESKEFEIFGKANLNTGKVGAKGTVGDFGGFGFTLDLGSAEQSLEIAIGRSSSGKYDIRIKWTKTLTELGGTEWHFGPAGGSEKMQKKESASFSLRKGFMHDKEVKFEKIYEDEIGPVTINQVTNEKQIEHKVDVSVNAVMIGFGVEAGQRVVNSEMEDSTEEESESNEDNAEPK